MGKKETSVEELRQRYEKTLTILGQPYHIKIRNPERDPRLGDTCDGYCDWTTKEIVISDMQKDETATDAVGDFTQYREKVLRHEIIHAFIEESGNADADWHTEEMVCWLSSVLPRLHALIAVAGSAGVHPCEMDEADNEPTEPFGLGQPTRRQCVPPYKAMNC